MVKGTNDDFLKYKTVKELCLYNMLDPMAIIATGLSEEIYYDIVDNYEEYKRNYYEEKLG